jgi:ribosome maturation factor RimP
MEKKCMDRLIGKHCKIVTKEPGEERTYIVTGMVKDIDQNAWFIIIESKQGPNSLNIKAIVAIKPKVKR